MDMNPFYPEARTSGLVSDSGEGGVFISEQSLIKIKSRAMLLPAEGLSE